MVAQIMATTTPAIAESLETVLASIQTRDDRKAPLHPAIMPHIEPCKLLFNPSKSIEATTRDTARVTISMASSTMARITAVPANPAERKSPTEIKAPFHHVGRSKSMMPLGGAGMPRAGSIGA